MKRNFILLFVLLVSSSCFSQYIGVRAKYTDTRVIPNPPHNDTRQNRLILSFYEVSWDNVWTPVSLSNYDIYLHEDGVQVIGISGVLDSVGSNYPGYNFTAPNVAAYYNSKGQDYWDCSTYGVYHYIVNGHELDCGWHKVSEWVTNYLDEEVEQFTTIDVAMYWYVWPNPYFSAPGNVNFGWPTYLPNPPYNLYNYICGGYQELVMRGALPSDSTPNFIPLPVHFSEVKADLDANCRATIKWSNLTESDIAYYKVEKSINGGPYFLLDSILPLHNNGGRADYAIADTAAISGFNLYRIKGTEITGNSFYSMVLRVNSCRSGSGGRDTNLRLRVYPNPAGNGRFYLNTEDLPKGNYTVTLTSPTGQQTIVTRVDHDGGPFNKLLNLDWMPPGIYTIQLHSTEITLTQKVFISRY